MRIEGMHGLLLAIALATACAAQARADTLTVTNTDDAGTGSLRAAISTANTSAGEDIIQFQTGLAGTISLQSPLPVLSDDLQLLGPGAGQITISGGGTYRVFYVDTGVSVTLSALTIGDGLSAGFGGAIRNLGDLVVDSCVIRDSDAVTGGGISNEGVLTVLRSLVTGNSASFAGGGIENFEGSVSVVESTIAGNSAEVGGGIENARDTGATPILSVINSTISGNTAVDFGSGEDNFGGGIDNFEGEATLLFSTITNNSAQFGGGVLNEGDFAARNSLVAGNPAGGDCDNDFGTSFDASGDNRATDASCPGFVTATAGELALGALTDNGGPTPTHALGEGSVAIDPVADCTDFSETTPVGNDQRGEPRPSGAACDTGAFEFQVTEPQPGIIFQDRFQGN